ncbi:MAG: type I-E CRISPR-associated protein Cas7/Cse4/CasC [Brevinematales bacterium]|nr:type I-E CRISPR-associated protein Cas7/Cse4/CasC [Brevinematales bacterium]
MKHLELHILQSFPVTCLNRDDLGSPKTAIFGGVQRARVSSQCWKSVVRLMAREYSPELFRGKRTKLVVEPITQGLIKRGFKEEEIAEALKDISGKIGEIDKKAATKLSTLLFTTDQEIDLICDTYAKNRNVKDLDKIFKEDHYNIMKDAADIALFGRMVASSPELKIEGAAVFSHALSTHKADNEIDYFTAVDDEQEEDITGAGHIGTLEFNSATYYRFCAVNMDELSDDKHLGVMSKEERKEVLASFIRSVLLAVPIARRNSMNGNTLPGYVLCVVREKGHPVQLINAFEKPITQYKDSGIFDRSKDAMLTEYDNLEKNWGMTAALKAAIPDISLDKLIEKATAYVD